MNKSRPNRGGKEEKKVWNLKEKKTLPDNNKKKIGEN